MKPFDAHLIRISFKLNEKLSHLFFGGVGGSKSNQSDGDLTKKLYIMIVNVSLCKKQCNFEITLCNQKVYWPLHVGRKNDQGSNYLTRISSIFVLWERDIELTIVSIIIILITENASCHCLSYKYVPQVSKKMPHLELLIVHDSSLKI